MPEMFVNLGNYKFLTAKAINYEKSKFISYIISVGKNTGYIQINQFGEEIEKNIKKEHSKRGFFFCPVGQRGSVCVSV